MLCGNANIHELPSDDVILRVLQKARNDALGVARTLGMVDIGPAPPSLTLKRATAGVLEVEKELEDELNDDPSDEPTSTEEHTAPEMIVLTFTR